MEDGEHAEAEVGGGRAGGAAAGLFNTAVRQRLAQRRHRRSVAAGIIHRPSAQAQERAS